MTDYLIYDTQTQADAANQVIYQTGLQLRTLAGYTVDAGGLIGRMAGVDNPAGGRTSGWDIPKQRQTDNKWCVLHPNTNPKAQAILPNGQKALDVVMAALGAVSVDVDPGDGSWFPGGGVE